MRITTACFGSAIVLAFVAWAQSPAASPAQQCSIRLLEIPADPKVDPKMILPVKPFHSKMPNAQVPAPPCPKNEPSLATSISRQLKPPLKPQPFPRKFELIPNPFKQHYDLR